ncbi:heterokaryon incompatibility protein-domain-containing protein [Sphaerosporella brunnea]|uniref:Heterokaryon incompatibility protein-domain-containing protein n=1 Tax=Sphaerosporella brunnea TaxID=1250544 RepID=A0A5J5EQ64_9PEZI|nr:heterokaryon incompatibility protein-domain-containing protein [Sphaerosporella brunnea]
MDCLNAILRRGWFQKPQTAIEDGHKQYTEHEVEPPQVPKPSVWLPEGDTEQDENLCSLCRRLDFRTILTHGVATDECIPLGFFVDLLQRSSSCGFCRLATTAIVRGWKSFVPDWEACEGVERVQCELRCVRVWAPAPSSPARFLQVRVDRLPPKIAESKVRSGRVDRNVIFLLADDAHLVGLEPRYHNRPVPKNYAEVSGMKEWLSVCKEFHAAECAKEIDENMSKAPSSLRVIDIQENRLVPVKSSPSEKPLPFVALSYVWGDVSTVAQYRTEISNFRRRTEKGGLDGVSFPRTIQDAIVLVGLLGERYLWIDAVCIIQDDGDDQAAQIHSMNIIYGASYLTVVGAGGDSANVGLTRAHPGSPSKDVVSTMETIQGIRMMLPLPPLPEALRTTRWITRGWTYQERLLPARRLYFTPEQVYFECRRCSWSEDVVAEERTFERNKDQASASGGNQLRRRSFRTRWGDTSSLFLEDYGRRVAEYTKRNVSFDSDVLNAFMGVANVWVESWGVQNRLFYGLPGAHIESALLWQPKAELVRRNSGENGVHLPSWSWAGWRGQITYSDRNYWMSIGPWPCGLIEESVVPEWILHTSNTESQRLEVKAARKWKRAPGEKPLSRPPPVPPSLLSPIGDAARPANIHGGVLEFLTTSAFFKVRTGSEHGKKCYCYDGGKPPHEHADMIHLIVDARGNAAGNIFLDRKTLEITDICNTACEFIILSRSGGGETTCPGLNEELYPHLEFCLFDTMLIEWRDGLAYRLGLGKIHEDAWVQAEPKWKRIFLS